MNDIKGIIEDVEKSNLVSNKVIKKVIEIIGQDEWNDIFDEEDDTYTTTGELIITLKSIPDLEKENEELKKELKISQRCWQDQKNISLDANCSLYKAKDLIRNLLRVTYGEGWNYSLDWKVKAEQFLKESDE